MIIEGKPVASGWLSRKALCCVIHTIKGKTFSHLSTSFPNTSQLGITVLWTLPVQSSKGIVPWGGTARSRDPCLLELLKPEK